MTVRSEDRRTWLTKLDRIGELSAKEKGLVFNNLCHILEADMLKEQYRLLDAKKAIGIDKVTKAAYGVDLDGNISRLIQRIRRGTYKSKPARITEIPKEDGSKRPLAISCLEDKLVQLACATILNKIYEPLFHPSSYGYRPGKSCHDALKALSNATYRYKSGAIVEIDIRKYFNTIPHKELMWILREKISDRRFQRLIEVLITAPIRNGGREEANIKGCPQGSILSPILSNIYLHYVIDEWFDSIKRTHLMRDAELIRVADDMVFAFESKQDAERFYEVLPKRLAKYGLAMHMEKSQLITAGHLVALKASQRGDRLPSFKFLGFTCYWGKSRNGFWRLKYTSRKDRFTVKLKAMREYLRKNLNARSTADICSQVIQVVRGWINYHAISDNNRRVSQFILRTKHIMYWWFNRRGGKLYVSRVKVLRILKALGFPEKWKTKSMF